MNHGGEKAGNKNWSRKLQAVMLQPELNHKPHVFSWLATSVRLACLVLPSLLIFSDGCSRGPEASDTAPPKLPPPHFSVAGGVYTADFSVRLTSSSLGSVIRYTLDGSDPTSRSKKFSDPIQISDTALLKAKVFGTGSSNSAVASQTYVLLGPDVAKFDSNLPLVILNAFSQNITQEKKVTVSARFIDVKAGRTTLAGQADFDGRGNLNVRGHTSLRYPKHSYHFKAMDESHSPLKVPIFGFHKESDWVLYAPYSDKTLMRDVLGYELSNEMGRYAARTKFVEVFLNVTGGKLSRRDYLGVYVFEEKIKRSKHRVDIEKLGPNDNTEPNVSGGYIFKKDHLDKVELGGSNPGGFPNGAGRSYSREYLSGPGGFPGDPKGFLPAEGRSYGSQNGLFQGLAGIFGSGTPPGFTSSHGSHFFFVEPDAREMTSTQRKWLAEYVNKCESALYGGNFKDPTNGYRAYLDTDSFIDHHLLVEITKNIDGFRFSTFFYKDRGGKIKMGPIWDWNLSFGAAVGKQGYMPEYWYWPQLDDQQYTWFRRLFEDSDFGQRYVDRWGQLRTNQFVVSKLHARIDELADLLSEAQARNFQRWRIMGRSVYPNNYTGHSYRDEVKYMKQWIEKRVEWIDQQFLAAPSVSVEPATGDSGSSLSLRAPMGKIYYTTDGTDPRAPGGGVSPSARLFSDAVPLLKENTAIFCRAHHNNRWSYPAVSTLNVSRTTAKRGN